MTRPPPTTTNTTSSTTFSSDQARPHARPIPAGCRAKIAGMTTSTSAVNKSSTISQATAT